MSPELKDAIAKSLDLRTEDLEWHPSNPHDPNEWETRGETDDLGYFELRVCLDLYVFLQVGILDLRSDLETLDVPETAARLVAAVKGFNAALPGSRA